MLRQERLFGARNAARAYPRLSFGPPRNPLGLPDGESEEAIFVKKNRRIKKVF